jgi:CBS domain-containing protein
MHQVKHLLESKGSAIFTIARMRPCSKRSSIWPSTASARCWSCAGHLFGIVSERDYARKVILQGRSSAQTAVSDIMRSEPLTVGPDTDVFDCMRLCTDSRVRHLPVMQDNAVDRRDLDRRSGQGGDRRAGRTDRASAALHHELTLHRPRSSTLLQPPRLQRQE